MFEKDYGIQGKGGGVLFYFIYLFILFYPHKRLNACCASSWKHTMETKTQAKFGDQSHIYGNEPIGINEVTQIVC